MGARTEAKPDAGLPIWQRKVVRTNPKGAKTECLLANGASILLSNFLASFIRPGDELLFPLDVGAGGGRTQIYIRHNAEEKRRQDVFQAEIGYAAQPRRDRRDNLFVSVDVRDTRLGISAINLRCMALRDYFYVGNRRRAWNRQSSFYELLGVDPKVLPAELRLAFKLRSLELRTADAPTGDIRSLERAFNMLAYPELRACYDALLNDPDSAAVFPYGGFGSLLVAGDCSRDGSTFYASRILSFLPEQNPKRFRIPLRSISFYADHAIYRDSRSKVEVYFDRACLPLLWDVSWNRWKHLLGAKIGIEANFIQSGKYRYRGDAWHLVKWERALPSRTEVALPANVAEQIAEARETHHRFGQFGDGLDRIRARVESTPFERAELQKMCAALGIPGDFEVSRLNWKPDYDAFYYKQLSKRARRVYLFRSEYIFDLERAVIVETPQLGHATYLFCKPTSMSEFLSIYSRVSREEIRWNRGNIAEKLGFLGRLVHGPSPRTWINELRARLGEPVNYAGEVAASS